MNYRDFLQKVIYAIINPLIKAMIAVGITPNIVTFVGFLGNIVAAGFFLDAAWMLGTEQADYASCMVTVGWGGFIILAAGLFDMMDGRLARMSGKSSLFGALWDSTLDRYSELVSLFGICLIFVRMQGDMTWFWMSVVTFAAMIGSVMVSYVRARAEGLDIECKVGFMQRPERVVVTAVTAMITGFTGNICLKAYEGVSKFILRGLKDIFMTSALTKLSALGVKKPLARFRKKVDTAENGGNPILGLCKPVIKAHGSSDARAFANAIRQATRLCESGVLDGLEAEIAAGAGTGGEG